MCCGGGTNTYYSELGIRRQLWVQSEISDILENPEKLIFKIFNFIIFQTWKGSIKLFLVLLFCPAFKIKWIPPYNVTWPWKRGSKCKKGEREREKERSFSYNYYLENGLLPLSGEVNTKKPVWAQFPTTT